MLHGKIPSLEQALEGTWTVFFDAAHVLPHLSVEGSPLIHPISAYRQRPAKHEDGLFAPRNFTVFPVHENFSAMELTQGFVVSPLSQRQR
jgi:hypothetical protein